MNLSLTKILTVREANIACMYVGGINTRKSHVPVSYGIHTANGHDVNVAAERAHRQAHLAQTNQPEGAPTTRPCCCRRSWPSRHRKSDLRSRSKAWCNRTTRRGRRKGSPPCQRHHRTSTRRSTEDVQQRNPRGREGGAHR